MNNRAPVLQSFDVSSPESMVAKVNRAFAHVFDYGVFKEGGTIDGDLKVTGNLIVDGAGAVFASPPPGDSSGALATTAWVQNIIASIGGGPGVAGVASFCGRTGAVVPVLSDIAGAAQLASPAFSGAPTAPNPEPGDNSRRIATTAFVGAAVNGLAEDVAAAAELYARADHVHAVDRSLAPLASPVFSGEPTAPTASPWDNSAKLATTRYVDGAISVAAASASITYARADHVHPVDNSRASVTSPCFVGVPCAPTAAPGDESTQLATTAFVHQALMAYVPPWRAPVSMTPKPPTVPSPVPGDLWRDGSTGIVYIFSDAQQWVDTGGASQMKKIAALVDDVRRLSAEVAALKLLMAQNG
jgi:hypothetical protein